MSKFLDLIESVVKDNDYLSTTDVDILDRASDRVKRGSKDRDDIELDKKNQKLKQKRKDLANKLKSSDVFEANEEGEQKVPQSPEDDVENKPVVDTLSPEGEVFYVDLIKKALFVDLDNVTLTSTERDMVTHDVTPENAKEVARAIQKIIDDYGLI